MNRMNGLRSFFEESRVNTIDDGENRLKVVYEKHRVFAEPVGDDAVRIVMGMGVHVTHETEPCVRAVMSYLEGWFYRVAKYDIDDGEAVFIYERSIYGPESATKMLLYIKEMVRESRGFIEKAAQGETPQVAAGVSPSNTNSETAGDPSDTEADIDSTLAELAVCCD